MVLTFTKRSASPLHFESIETRVEDILYPGSEEEDSADEDKKEKKRLRIEILGRQYLDGKPLLIQTASLRGPFENRWVNPWASKKREHNVGRSPEAPAATADRLPRTTDAEEPHAVKRRSAARDESVLPSKRVQQEVPLFIRTLEREGPTTKRRKHTQSEGKQTDSHVDVQDGYHHHWLKTDRPQLRTNNGEQFKSPTPTPAPIHRARPAASIAPLDALHSAKSPDNQLNDVQTSGFTLVNRRSATREIKSPERVNLPKTRADQVIMPRANGSGSFVKERTLGTVDERTRQGYREVKRLSQEAVRRAGEEHGYAQANKLSQEAASRAYQAALTPSRLTPYVSAPMTVDDAASSAGLKARSRAPRPSPHVVPPSTNLPEFKYNFVPKRSSVSSARQAPLIEAQEALKPRPRSESSSSSGSSEFAAALEAAQAKVTSGASSCSSSPPAVGNNETTSVKKNTNAMRRLTVSSSGVPNFVDSRDSLRPGSSSSAINPQASPIRRPMMEPKASAYSVPVAGPSSKSSLRLNGESARSSVVLPEAQIVPDAPIQLAQLISVPSIDLLETDRQSPTFPSLDEGDSYFDLSTQAAALKAQRRFQEDLSGLIDLPELAKIEEKSPTRVKPCGQDITPVPTSAQRRGQRGRQIVKSEDSDEEEPMSTQAMMDAMSPFAITTVKKKAPPLTKQTNFALLSPKEKSPTPAPALSPGTPTTGLFHEQSFSMSTSPSPSPPKPSPPIPLSHPDTTSKPPSSLTSFSILPNGTLTETSIYQDGQQPQNDFDISLPLDPFGTPTNRNINPPLDNVDLNAAIEDAGSFLGDWDVETEARKEGNSNRKRAAGTRGILSFGS